MSFFNKILNCIKSVVYNILDSEKLIIDNYSHINVHRKCNQKYHLIFINTENIDTAVAHMYEYQNENEAYEGALKWIKKIRYLKKNEENLYTTHPS